MRNIYFRERDEHGKIVRRRPASLSPKEVFWAWWRKRGLKEPEIQKKWEAKQRKAS